MCSCVEDLTCAESTSQRGKEMKTAALQWLSDFYFLGPWQILLINGITFTLKAKLGNQKQ